MSVLKTLRTRGYNEPINTDDLYYVLSNRRRRMILQYLLDHNSSQPITRRTLVNHLVEQIPSISRSSANVSLYQTHIPTLAEHGMVDFTDRGLVSITERGLVAIMIHAYIQCCLNANR
jgi:DNA-binding transcriptional ArsR family regulator